MPSLLTHQWFSHQLIERYASTFPYLKKHAQVVYLGAQGPDPLFFYGRAPFHTHHDRKEVNALGSFLHNGKLEQTLEQLIITSQQYPEDEVIQSYLLGALSHYALDRHIHPYVYYRSGFDEMGLLSGHFQGDHGRFEVLIDNALKKKFSLEENMYNPKFTLGINHTALTSISHLYAVAYPSLFKQDTFKTSVIDMRKVYDFLYHSPFYNRLLLILAAGKRSLPYGLVHPNHISTEQIDEVLNSHHHSWRHPVTGETYEDDFFQLVEKAFARMDMLIQFIQDRSIAFETIHEHVDYDGRVIGTTLRFYKSLFPAFKAYPQEKTI